MENEIFSLIGSYCFPIVACVFMFKYLTNVSKENRQDILKLNEQHHAEMIELKDEFSKAINNNTIALTKLCEKLDEKGGDINEIK